MYYALVTGASSGIGRAIALRLVEQGYQVVCCARSEEALAELSEQTEGKCLPLPVDLSEQGSAEFVWQHCQNGQLSIDVLVNCAGYGAVGHHVRHSAQSLAQMCRLNVNTPTELCALFGREMRERRSGHILNVSSIGVLTNAPRFSAYVASKSALDAFSRCLSPEVASRNIDLTAVYMPLVRTPMIAPTKMYDYVPTLSPDEAADMVCKAIRGRPKVVTTRLGTFAQVLWALTPNILDVIFNTSFRLFPDSAAARGDKKVADTEPTAEAVAFAALTRGVHW